MDIFWVKQKQVTISQSCVPILLHGSTGCAAICNKSVLYVFFTISNTSLSTVPFINDFLGYYLADLYDLGHVHVGQSFDPVEPPLPLRPTPFPVLGEVRHDIDRCIMVDTAHTY